MVKIKSDSLQNKRQRKTLLKNVKPGQQKKEKKKIYMWGSGEAFLFLSKCPFSFSTEQIFLR